MTKPAIRIAVDAMGGDHAPREIVKGALWGARKFKVGVLLVGREDDIKAELEKSENDTSGLDIEVVHASEVIEMGESPATALRKKKDSSIIVTAKCVREGRAQGMVAAGSTGAAMASALLYVGRIDGVDRPAIGVTLPSLNPNRRCMLLDAGANADCTPEMMMQFAKMGNIYMESVFRMEKPRVGLLNIGEEMGKGNTLINAAFELLENEPSINFIGNVEGKEMFMGQVDVAVADGFSGNIALKSAEGVLKMFKSVLKKEVNDRLPAKMGYLLGKSAFDAAGKFVDPEEFGGALLLGIKGLCVISHGSSKALGISNAVRVAKEAVETDILGKIGHRIREGVHV